MGLDTTVSADLDRHSPFQAALHSFRDYSNERTPPRILLNYSGLLYLHQITVFLNDKFLTDVKGAEVDTIELMDSLGTFFLVDLSKKIGSLLTFTFILNGNTNKTLSSVTFFLWVNREIEDITVLQGRFTGNFRLRSSRSLEINYVFDALYSIGFAELRNFSMIDNLDFALSYPIFRSYEIHTTQGVEVTEMVEELKMSGDFIYEPHCQTILYAQKTHYTDPTENDILIKTLFTPDYFPNMTIKYYGDKVFIILENFYLENFFRVPPSIISFCDQEPSFLDPFFGLRPAFVKSFWKQCYHGSISLFEYLYERGARGKMCFNHLPSFVLMEW